MSENVLIMYGSPKGDRGSSANIVNVIADRLKEEGSTVDTVVVNKLIDQEEGMDRLVQAVDRADSLVISFPLYIDTLPAGVIEAFSGLYHNKERIANRPRKFLAICNNGFPESRQNRYALRSCQFFAERMGMEFYGAVAIGQGGMFGSNAQGQVRIGKRQTEALRSIGSALAEGSELPKEAIDTLAKPAIPIWMYTSLGNMSWNKASKKNGVRKEIKAQPYARK